MLYFKCVIFDKFFVIFPVLGHFASILTLAYGTVRSSAKLHTNLLKHVLRCPYYMFCTVPTGRILNRFSHDIHVVDNDLPDSLRNSLKRVFTVCNILIQLLVIFHCVSHYILINVCP